MEKKGRIYVCHTYYHVYVALLKELNLGEDERFRADLVLSLMSNDFESLSERIRENKVFENVYLFDEQKETAFPEIVKLKEDRGNIVLNMISRIKFTKRFAKAQSPFVPVDFKKYKDVYVFCDSDPIGLYLNQNKIKYHALEDGLNYLKPYSPVPAKADNSGCLIAFEKLEALRYAHFLKKDGVLVVNDQRIDPITVVTGAAKYPLNLIFIRDGYSKYCTDMEVNDISVIDDSFRKYKEVPRALLLQNLDKDAKELLIRVFVKDYDELKIQLSKMDSDKKNIIILTEPLCKDFAQRERLFRDLVNEYSKEGTVFLKPHPRDELDYPVLFADCKQFDRSIPMEILNFLEDISFDKVVSVYTQLDAIRFAREKVFLGHDFMDKYEDPEVHRKNKK